MFKTINEMSANDFLNAFRFGEICINNGHVTYGEYRESNPIVLPDYQHFLCRDDVTTANDCFLYALGWLNGISGNY